MYIRKDMTKLSVGFYLAIVILCIVLVMTLSTSYNVVPFSPNSLNQSSFEGFRSLKPVNYSTYPDNKVIDMKDRFLIADTSAEKTAQRVWGFDGLYGPFQTNDATLDMFANTKSSMSCGNSSSGLSDSTGYLCLDEKQINMLRTRGQNQTGGGSYIGAGPA
jgi:hypothetical protein